MGVGLKFIQPSTFLVAGPTGCGKSSWVAALLRSNAFVPAVEKVYWCYSQYQTLYDEIAKTVPNVEFVPGLIDVHSLDSVTPKVCVLDDMMTSITHSDTVAELFTKLSHHCNVSVVLILQNIFPRGRTSRTISLNAHYIILFKNPRDASQVNHLASQMYPGRSRFLKEAYALATALPHGYLCLDLHQATPESLRLRSRVLPSDPGDMIVYNNA